MCLLARFGGDRRQWRIDGGEYTMALARVAGDLVEAAEVALAARSFDC